MHDPFTETTEAYIMFNTIFAMPSIADAALIYGLGWMLVLVPFLLAWVAAQIVKTLSYFQN